MFKTLQKIGKAFMLPIAILPAAGLLLGIGGALSNPTTVKSYPVLDNPILQDIFQVMSQLEMSSSKTLPCYCPSACASAWQNVTREPRHSPASPVSWS